MKIIHLILGKANPNRMNGVNKVVDNLASTQSDMGLDVEVWGVTNDLTHNYPQRNYITRLFVKHKNPFFITTELKKEIKKSVKTTFHLHGGFVPQYYSISRILALNNKPYILTSHGSYNKEALKKSELNKRIYFNLFERSVIKQAKYIHLIGKSEYDHIDQLIKDPNKILIPNGQELLDVKINEQSIGLIIGFCGRLKINVKGLDILFKGFSQFIKKTDSNAQLWLIGDGEDLDDLIQLSYDLGINNQVKFYGAQFGEAKNNLISKMDYFCHTSRYEGLPTAVLEASSLGVPCIVSAETNMKEYINNHRAGIGLDDNNAEELAKTFKSIAKESIQEREYKKNNAKQMIVDEFSWTKICSDLAHYYFD